MEIKLNLKRHCIATEVKRLYDAAISAYFRPDPALDKKELERRIDLLHHGLETLDFGQLRNRFSQLRGGGDADVVIAADRDKGLIISINGATIYAEH